MVDLSFIDYLTNFTLFAAVFGLGCMLGCVIADTAWFRRFTRRFP